MSSSQPPVRVVVAGGINCDFFYRVPSLPQKGETVMGRVVGVGQPRVGGKAANSAVACARMGAHTTFIGAFGDDSNSEWLKKQMTEEYGVDISSAFDLKQMSCGVALILLLPDNDNGIVVANAPSESWPRCLSAAQKHAIRNCDMLLLQREIPEEYNLRLARFAKECKVPVLLDVGGHSDKVSTELLDLVSILSPNETEVDRMVQSKIAIGGMDASGRQPIAGAVSQLEEIQALNERHSAVTLLKQGSRGCALVRGRSDPLLFAAALPLSASQVADTTGAGDCFTGSFAVEFVRCTKASLRVEDAYLRAMRFATASAGLSVQTEGCADSVPTLSQVKSTLAKGGHFGADLVFSEQMSADAKDKKTRDFVESVRNSAGFVLFGGPLPVILATRILCKYCGVWF